MQFLARTVSRTANAAMPQHHWHPLLVYVVLRWWVTFSQGPDWPRVCIYLCWWLDAGDWINLDTQLL